MTNYYRIMLGKGSMHAAECIAGGFIGADYDIHQDLSRKLPDEWREFNKNYIPVFISNHPGKSKVSAGLACGALWSVSKGIKKGELVLCPDGTGQYHVGEVLGDYYYTAGQLLPHRRKINWRAATIDRASMSQALRRSTGSIGTVSTITHHAQEIERLLGTTAYVPPISLVSLDPDVEDPVAFAMEKHMEDFLVNNWASTELGQKYDIYEEDGEAAGQQYPTDTGPIDILAISKDKKTLLVVELKRGKASDVVVGQTLRYMGFVQQELAEDNQQVRGVIIALEPDIKLTLALRMVPNIAFYRYLVSFKLVQDKT